ncbi:MAG: ureidoglycolate lyase [Myxococcales bacterium]|nr:ureidoglycolate lyase [Myxococcales bacterium]
MRTLTIEPLTQERFGPFGDVVSAGLGAGKDANQGTAVRFDWTSKLESSRPHANANLVVARCQPKTLPFEVKLLERHPCSTQAFIPMSCARYLVVVALAQEDGSPNLDSLRAFECRPGQGINYRRNVWHHPMIALDEPADFAMLVWEDNTADDCIEHWLSSPISVT